MRLQDMSRDELQRHAGALEAQVEDLERQVVLRCMMLRETRLNRGFDALAKLYARIADAMED